MIYRFADCVLDTDRHALTRAGEMLARMSGDPETLDATLKFENGRAFLGPIPIGAAPVIRLP